MGGPKSKSATDRVIVALDVSTLEDALALAEELREWVGGFKVGLQLLSAQGSKNVVSELAKLRIPIFYDAKFNDIPNTIAGASKAVSDMGVWMFNVHASAGRAGLEAAARNKGDSKLLAVTVLTSIASEECEDLFGQPSLEKVVQFARLATKCGADGIICSPRELAVIKGSEQTRQLQCVVPGIRPTWAATEDQSRYATPKEAVLAGADYLVIGRPITQPPHSVGGPLNAAKRISDEIREALS
jgi:orotidine-5'-phosphate decarboxylase